MLHQAWQHSSKPPLGLSSWLNMTLIMALEGEHQREKIGPAANMSVTATVTRQYALIVSLPSVSR